MIFPLLFGIILRDGYRGGIGKAVLVDGIDTEKTEQFKEIIRNTNITIFVQFDFFITLSPLI